MTRIIYRIFLVISILVLLSLACNLGSKKTSAGEKEGTQVQKTEVVETEDLEDQLPELGEVRRSEEGGYSYRVIPNYKVESSIGITSMLAPEGSYEAGPLVMIIGGVKDEGSTTESVYENMKASSTAVTFSNERKIKIDGQPGMAADFSGTLNGEEILGRVALAVTDRQQISILANAPKDRWNNELAPLFEAVIKSIQLFEPAEEVTLAEPTAAPLPTKAQAEPTSVVVNQPKMKTLRQWATVAYASSEYTSEDWSANQATGKPNTPNCGDAGTAWASATADGREWLEVYYVDFVIPTEVNIYISYAPNQVVLVELLGVDGGIYEIYNEAPYNPDTCPFILSVPVKDVNEEVVAVRITIDQSFHNSWNEIDAVELVGLVPDTSAVQPQPTVDTGFDYSVFSFTQTPMSQVDPGKFHCEVKRDQQDMFTLMNPETIVNVFDVEYQLIATTYEPNIFISIFLPKNYSPGQVYINEYASATPGEQATATIAIGQELFQAYDGWMYITEANGKFTGGIMFLSASTADPSATVETRCLFNQLPKDVK